MAQHCTECRTTNEDQAKFCVSCGATLNPINSSVSAPSYIEGSKSKAACLWCKQTTGFREEEGKLDSKFGFTAHKMKIYTCNNCGYVHLFGLGRTIFDFD